MDRFQNAPLFQNGLGPDCEESCTVKQSEVPSLVPNFDVTSDLLSSPLNDMFQDFRNEGGNRSATSNDCFVQDAYLQPVFENSNPILQTHSRRSAQEGEAYEASGIASRFESRLEHLAYCFNDSAPFTRFDGEENSLIVPLGSLSDSSMHFAARDPVMMLSPEMTPIAHKVPFSDILPCSDLITAHNRTQSVSSHD